MTAQTLDRAPALDLLTVPELSQLCLEEAARYQSREPSAGCYGLELFHRAIVLRDDAAWSAIYAQYADLVRRWLSPWPEVADELVVATFERFWQALDVDKFDRFASLAAVLQYLKMCALSARMDRGRATRATAGDVPLDDAVQALPAPDSVEEELAGRADAASFWQAVQSCVPDERERAVLRLSYVIGLSPREICRRHAQQFPHVAEVYRIKRTALERLRRAPAMQEHRPH